MPAMKVPIKSMLTLAFLGVVFTAGALDYYVSPTTGSNGNTGRSPDAPLQTLQWALNYVANGDTIHLRSGTYAESVYSDKGSADQPITVQPYLNEVPVMTRGGSESAMWLETQGMIIRGIRFTRGHLVLRQSSNARVESCRFEGITNNIALYLGDCHGVTLQGNTFSGNRHTSTLVLEQTTGDIVVMDNVLKDNYPCTGSTFNVILVANASGTTLISGNLVCNTVAFPVAAITLPLGNDANAIMVYRSVGVTVSGNTVQDFRFKGYNDDTSYDPAYLKTPEQGGEVGSGISVVGSTPVVVESITVTSNTVFNCSRHGIVCSYVNNSLIASNHITDCGNFGIFLTGIANDHSQVRENVVADNVCGRNGWLHGGTSGISFIAVGTGNIMRRNFSFQNRQGTAGTVGDDWFGDGMGLLADLYADGTIIENNLSVENEGCGIALNADNCTVVNNTVVGNGSCPHHGDSSGILVNGDTGHANNATIVNNLIYNNRLAQLYVFQTALGHTVHHNLYCAGPLTRSEHVGANNIGWGGESYSVAAWNLLMAASINGTGNLDVAPVFAGDTAQLIPKNFKLMKTSPGPTAGANLAELTAVIGYLIGWDFQHASRTVSAPAIGAFETDVSPAERAFAGADYSSSDWMHTEWFGWFMVQSFPWIWKDDLGFLYCVGQSTTGLWMYAFDMNDWLWTTQSQFPNLYSSREQAWLWYQTGSVNPKWFYNYTTGTWINR